LQAIINNDTVMAMELSILIQILFAIMKMLFSIMVIGICVFAFVQIIMSKSNKKQEKIVERQKEILKDIEPTIPRIGETITDQANLIKVQKEIIKRMETGQGEMELTTKQTLQLNRIIKKIVTQNNNVIPNYKEMFTFFHHHSTEYFLNQLLKSTLQQEVNFIANQTATGNSMTSPMLMIIDDIDSFKPDDYTLDPHKMNLSVVKKLEKFFMQDVRNSVLQFISKEPAQKNDAYLAFSDEIEKEAVRMIKSLNRDEKVMATFTFMSVNITDSIISTKQAKQAQIALNDALKNKNSNEKQDGKVIDFFNPNKKPTYH